MKKEQVQPGKFAQVFGGMFGFNTRPTAEDEKKSDAFIDNSELLELSATADGSEVIDVSYTGSVSNVNVLTQSFTTQKQIIDEYRNMSLQPEVDTAVDDIINAAITSDSDEDPIRLDLSKIEDLSDEKKALLETEYQFILELLDFSNTAYEKFRQFYIDGRLVYHTATDPQAPQDGIKHLVLLDPRSVKKVTELKKKPTTGGIELVDRVRKYYIYDPMLAADNNNASNSNLAASYLQRKKLEISEESLVMVHCGLISASGQLLSHLEKAKKVLNNMNLIEDSMVIYRLVRAPARRAFYVDTGSLPKKAAEEFVLGLKDKHRSTMSYNATSGRISGNQHQMTIMEDFWLPRREGGKGTEVQTIEGAANMGDIDDVLLLQKKLYRSLNVPLSRLESDSNIVLGGRSAEISRDEWKFGKFIQRLRRRFSTLFMDLLGKQVVAKGIVTKEEWKALERKIEFKYSSDTYTKEQQELDILSNQVNIVSTMDPFVGKYWSKETIERKVLGRTDEDIAKEKKLMDAENAENPPIQSEE